MSNEYIAKSVHECYVIAFEAAEQYQEMANNAETVGMKEHYLAKRDSASEIAQHIKYGERNESQTGKASV